VPRSSRWLRLNLRASRSQPIASKGEICGLRASDPTRSRCDRPGSDALRKQKWRSEPKGLRTAVMLEAKLRDEEGVSRLDSGTRCGSGSVEKRWEGEQDELLGRGGSRMTSNGGDLGYEVSGACCSAWPGFLRAILDPHRQRYNPTRGVPLAYGSVPRQRCGSFGSHQGQARMKVQSGFRLVCDGYT
jgi:hypothetical protein